MGEIVNLRRARKKRARDDAEAEAAKNRAAHGRTKAERRMAATKRGKDEAALDGHRLEERPAGPDAE